MLYESCTQWWAIHNIGADSYRYYNGAQSLKRRSMREQPRVSAPADITIGYGRWVFIEKKWGNVGQLCVKVGKCLTIRNLFRHSRRSTCAEAQMPEATMPRHSGVQTNDHSKVQSNVCRCVRTFVCLLVCLSNQSNVCLSIRSNACLSNQTISQMFVWAYVLTIIWTNIQTNILMPRL